MMCRDTVSEQRRAGGPVVQALLPFGRGTPAAVCPRGPPPPAPRGPLSHAPAEEGGPSAGRRGAALEKGQKPPKEEASGSAGAGPQLPPSLPALIPRAGVRGARLRAGPSIGEARHSAGGRLRTAPVNGAVDVWLGTRRTRRWTHMSSPPLPPPPGAERGPRTARRCAAVRRPAGPSGTSAAQQPLRPMPRDGPMNGAPEGASAQGQAQPAHFPRPRAVGSAAASHHLFDDGQGIACSTEGTDRGGRAVRHAGGLQRCHQQSLGLQRDAGWRCDGGVMEV